VLSHADDDHIGNASRLLLDAEIRVKRVFYNSDPTKGTDSQQQLQIAILTARRQRRTEGFPGLCSTVSGTFDCGEIQIEVLFPPPEALVTGVGGRGPGGKLNTSNSLSVAIRLSHVGKPVALLAGDIGVECLDFWNGEGINPSAQILVFPHHGGSPANANPGHFAEQISAKVAPDLIIFSLHRTRFDLPREDVVTAIMKARPHIQFLCTQLPARAVKAIEDKQPGPWSLHGIGARTKQPWWEGHIQIRFDEGIGRVTPYAGTNFKRRKRLKR
jgi:competence protein ComEC